MENEQKKAKVLIGLPTMSSMHTWLVMTLLSWVSENKISLGVYPTLSVQPVDNARNEIVEEFLKGDYTHLLFIDSDTIPPQDGLYKLLEDDRAIVTGITPIIEHDEKRSGSDSSGFYKKWNCVDMQDKEVQPNSGLIPIKGAGSSFILIKRVVFEKLTKPYYRFLYQDDNKKDVIVSEDIHFIAKALGAGIQAWADTSVICKHYKPIVW